MILFSRIGKENFELRKKLFEHLDESSFAGKNILLESINNHLVMSVKNNNTYQF
jgi:hypothetical protein